MQEKPIFGVISSWEFKFVKNSVKPDILGQDLDYHHPGKPHTTGKGDSSQHPFSYSSQNLLIDSVCPLRGIQKAWGMFVCVHVCFWERRDLRLFVWDTAKLDRNKKNSATQQQKNNPAVFEFSDKFLGLKIPTILKKNFRPWSISTFSEDKGGEVCFVWTNA